MNYTELIHELRCAAAVAPTTDAALLYEAAADALVELRMKLAAQIAQMQSILRDAVLVLEKEP